MRNFNGDIYYKPQNVGRFVASLVKKLKEITAGSHFLVDFEEKAFKDSLEILKALKNLIQYQNIIQTTDFMQEEHVSLLCRFLRFKDQDVV